MLMLDLLILFEHRSGGRFLHISPRFSVFRMGARRAIAHEETGAVVSTMSLNI
jgi:hypothetical protein